MTETNEKSISEPGDNLNQPNICVFGVPEGEKRERDRRKWEKMFEKFPNLMKCIVVGL